MKLLSKILVAFFMLTLINSLTLAQNQGQQDVDLTRIKYIKVDQENLRNAPNGKILAQAYKGSPVIILQENESWALIQFTAWVWKGSLTNVKPDLLTGEYHALHILVSSSETAQIVLNQIKSGKKDFQSLAKQYSIAPSAAKGGDLGFFNKGDFPESLESAILNLKVGEVSDIVETEFGFNIFKRLQ